MVAHSEAVAARFCITQEPSLPPQSTGAEIERGDRARAIPLTFLYAQLFAGTAQSPRHSPTLTISAHTSLPCNDMGGGGRAASSFRSGVRSRGR